MPTATCPSTDELRALSLGETHAEASESLLEHVANCTDCQAELETVDQHSDSLIASLRADDLGEPFEQEAAYQTALAKALVAYSIVSSEQGVIPELPKQIGEYEILRPLGHGGMGSVWLARHTKLGREVALKLLSRHRWPHPQMRERFEAEMRAIGRLSHPNIVIAHDARDVGGCAVLVTEYVDGFDLGKLLQRTGPLPVTEACEIVRQVAVALEYTHSQGFVHRDIKPSNVMLSRSGSIKLLDLGLARLQLDEGAAEMTATGQSLGTADYMAPEQVSDARSVDIRADIYSLGCTLMKLLTGRAPFAEQPTSFAKMTSHVSGQPPRLESLRADIPPALSELVARMLAKRPEERPQSPEDIRQALTALCAGSDLGQLVERAEACTPLSEVSQPALATAEAVSGTSARSRSGSGWLHRRVPTYTAIAAGFFGFLLGGLLSIIIIITNPDGTKSVLKLAEGSKVEIQVEGPGALQIGSEKMVPRSPVVARSEEENTVKETLSNALPWEAYNEQALAQYRAAGRPVLLFVFAEWALRGESLRREAIERPTIMKSLEQGNFILMKADWTGGTYELSTKLQELSSGERISIPLVAVYPAGVDTEPIVLRDNFNEARLQQAIQQALAASTPKPLQSDSVIPAPVTIESARRTIADALQVGFPDATPEVIQSLVETFFDPKYVKSCTLRLDRFWFRLRMSDAIEAMVLRGAELQDRVQESGAVTQADGTSSAPESNITSHHPGNENAFDLVTLVRALGDDLLVIPKPAYDDAQTFEQVKTMPMTFIFSPKDATRMQAMLTNLAEGAGWTPWREGEHQYFPIYSRSGDPKAADAIVCAIRFSVSSPQTDTILIGAYKRLRQALAVMKE